MENEAAVRIQEEIAKLEALLDQTPVLKAPAPTEATIPTSRPIPPQGRRLSWPTVSKHLPELAKAICDGLED